MKKSVVLMVLLLPLLPAAFFPLSAQTFGFDIQSDTVFLQHPHPVAPEVFHTIDASFFYTAGFTKGAHNFLIQPGVRIKNQRILPIIRTMEYTLFTDYASFSTGKTRLDAGMGILKNYFFLTIPNPQPPPQVQYPIFGTSAAPASFSSYLQQADTFSGVNSTGNSSVENPLWFLRCEIPYQNIVFSVGTALDTAALDSFTKPRWYMGWVKTAYTNPYFSAGFLFDTACIPKNGAEQTVIRTICTPSAEAAAYLPANVTLYLNGKTPIDTGTAALTRWGALAGMEKDFIFSQTTYSLIAEAAYEQAVFEYGVFNSLTIHDMIQVSAGITGVQNTAIRFIVQPVFFIGRLMFKAAYISRNILDQKAFFNGAVSFSFVLNDSHE